MTRLIALGLLLVAVPAPAQTTAAITDVVLRVTRPVDPLFITRELVIPWVTGVVCNQAPLAPPTLPLLNMVRFDVDDPARQATRDCRLTAAGLALSSAFFAALPTNPGYQATILYRSSAGDSDPSPGSGPFERTAGTACGVNLAGRQVSVRLTTGPVTVCVEPR